MPKFLQLRWTNETEWKTVEQVEENKTDQDVLKAAQALQRATDMKFPHHDFSAVFRIVELEK